MSTSPRLADEAAHRELIILKGGRWANAVYWADNFLQIQDAARRYPRTHAAGEIQCYQPTTEEVPHPGQTDATCTVWKFVEPIDNPHP